MESRIIKFKNEGTQISIPGSGVVNSSNLTPALYDKLVAISPSHAGQFTVKRVEKPKANVKSQEK